MNKDSKIISGLEWRYATKNFDKDKKISKEDLDEIIEAARLSASSFGLQPWKFVIITDAKLREELKKHSWNQAQVTDASHLIVLCSKKDIDERYISRYIESIANTRGIPVSSLDEYKGMINGFAGNLDAEKLNDWAKRQVYIALGTILLTCAMKGIDSCPMEGFDSSAYDKVLGLRGKGFTSAALCAVGYRANDDAASQFKKVRFPLNDVAEFR